MFSHTRSEPYSGVVCESSEADLNLTREILQARTMDQTPKVMSRNCSAFYKGAILSDLP